MILTIRPATALRSGAPPKPAPTRGPAVFFEAAGSARPPGCSDPAWPQECRVIAPAEIDRFLDAAREAVLRATLVVRDARQRVLAAGAFSKSDASPVTVADMAGQAVVARTLSERLGAAFTLVGEESSEPLRGPANSGARALAREIVAPVWADASDDDLLGAIDLGADKAGAGRESFWTLDPIDGTKGFMRPPDGHYCCCLAYIHKGEPVVGVLGCPTLDLDAERPLGASGASGLLMWSAAGRGVFKSALEPGAAARPVRCAPWDPSHTHVRVALSAEPDYAAVPRVLPVLEAAGLEARILRLDSQCKYAMVALGRADLFLRLPKRRESPDYIWDHAPGELVTRESGARMTDTHGSKLDFGAGRSLARNAGFVAASAALHERLMEVLGRGGW